ncbi:methylglutaconyl-CoA hydratase, mitochondrial [Orussus abietinus]|uniref:methylglutaconyl-CoA hydratase, mitochondrial n=1 Tax=Orussus abietinus TaxID=222816 RepID=UPI000625EE6A|nr:methylglutaconyl-CoA hydratase, mitochondrial [Orussus abietinus]XP_012271673.1 methylglutaconyl-CoA hydratase, mitochondrial [Orussus abietinus]XP_023289724.1 methylglutaconyl-CoA hydratase, mitochondrial [Orussus abietinus]
MASLTSKLKASAGICGLAKVAMRTLATQTMLGSKEEEKVAVVKYLDGKDNGIAVLGLNRPDARNAIGKMQLSQLNEAVSTIRRDDKVRVLIIRSLIPKIFCAGADLRERARMEAAEVSDFVAALRELMNNVEALPAPVISAIDGVALGGGLELALACDIRTASSEAKMGLVETKLAIIPGAGGTQRLPRLVGPAVAKELIYTAKILDGYQAHEIGLVNRVVSQNKEGDAAYQEALMIAREILPNGPVSVRLAKVAVTEGIDVPFEDACEIEQKCYDQLLGTKDRIEGLAAFSAKRVPVYRGL